MFLGILGGTPEHWSQYGLAYRDAWVKAGHNVNDADVAVLCMDLLARTIAKEGKFTFSMKEKCLRPVQQKQEDQ